MRPPQRNLYPKNGFSLMELLAIVAVMGILSALLVPAVNKVVDKGRAAKCMNNLKQLGSLFQVYVGDNDGFLPAAGTNNNENYTPPAGQTLNNAKSNWFVEIKDYAAEAVKLASNGKTSNEVYYKFQCPTYRSKYYGKPNYIDLWLGYGANLRMYNSVNDTTATNYTRQKLSKIPNPSRTPFLGEASGYNLDIHPYGYQFSRDSAELEGWKKGGTPDRHGEVSNYLFVDGHVEALSEKDAVAVIKPRTIP